MSYGSQYNLNQRLTYLESVILSLVPVLPVNLANVLLQGNSAGASDIDLNNQDILQVNNIDLTTINGSAYPPTIPVDTLQDVLDAGNTAIQTITLTDGVDITSVLQNNRLDITATDTSNTTGTFNASINGVAGVNCGMSVSTTTTFTAPFPPITALASLNTTPTTASIGLSQSAPFAPTQLMSLDLNNLTHNNSDNTTPFNISSNNAITMSADNFDLSSTGVLYIPSPIAPNNLQYDTGKLTVINDSVGGQANPLLVLQNNNTTGGANNGTTFETYKNDTPTSTGGDVVGTWSATCNTNVGKTEISRINQIAYGVGASNNDGGISLACKVNSAINNFLVCNGGVGAGEVQIFKPTVFSTTTDANDFIRVNPQTSANSQQLLMTATDGGGFTNSISLNNSQYAPSIELKADFGSPERSITITADGNISRNQITAFDSQANQPLQIISSNATGGGSIEFKPDDSSGSLIFTSSALEFSGSSADSGKRLKITLNGIPYYIPLESV